MKKWIIALASSAAATVGIFAQYAAIGGPVFSTGPVTCAAANGFSACKVITVDHTKVPNTDQTNFPVLIQGTYTYLKSTGNGGLVQNSGTCHSITCPFDVVLTSDSGCTTAVNWEVEAWSASTGAVTYWINRTVSHTTNTVFYMCVGKSSVMTDQSNWTGTWNGNFLRVFHFANNEQDSTSNAANLSVGGSPNYITGQIGTAGNQNGGAHQYGSGTGLPTGTSITATMETWFNLTGGTGIGSGQMGGWSGAGGFSAPTGTAFQMAWNGGADPLCLNTNNVNSCIAWTADTNWHHFVLATSGAATTLVAYLDGVAQTVATTGATFSGPVGANCFGAWNLPCVTPVTQAFTGALDEMRVSSVVLSADWIATEYNNQSSPGSFYTIN